MRDIKLKCGSFESRNMVFNTSYKICLHNVETDYLETFAKCWKPQHFLINYKAKDKSCKWLISSEKIDGLVKMQYFPEMWLFFAEFGYSSFLSGNPVQL